MGGRGMVSLSGGEKIKIGSLMGGKNDIRNVGGPSDQREDIQGLFRGLGFTDVQGLGGLPTSVLGSYGIAMRRLEREHGSIGALARKIPVKGMDSKDIVAAVEYDSTGTPTGLLLNRGLMSNITRMNAAQREMERIGWSMPTDGKVKSLARYSITHEYGHLTESALFLKARSSGSTGTEGQDARARVSAILKIAKGYGATREDVSHYGRQNSYEFFAEAFANAHSGKPNAIGRAMSEYLKRNRP